MLTVERAVTHITHLRVSPHLHLEGEIDLPRATGLPSLSNKNNYNNITTTTTNNNTDFVVDLLRCFETPSSQQTLSQFSPARNARRKHSFFFDKTAFLSPFICTIDFSFTSAGQKNVERAHLSPPVQRQVSSLPPEATIPSPRIQYASPPPSPSRIANRCSPDSPSRTGPRIWGCHTPIARKGSLSISRSMR